MVSIKQVLILALAGLSVAAPTPGKECGGRNRGGNPPAPQAAPQAMPSAAPQAAPEAAPQASPVAPSPAPAPVASVEAASAPSSPAPAQFFNVPQSGRNGRGRRPRPSQQPSSGGSSPAPSTPSSGGSSGGSSSTPSSGSGGSTSGGYMDVVNKFRSAGGHGTLSQDSTLVANAQKTVDDGNGSMVHQLNPGTFGQVLAQGVTEFEGAYLMWLCERPDLPEVAGLCGGHKRSLEQEEKRGETGHADILTSARYTKIGCAFFKGVWGCDLA